MHLAQVRLDGAELRSLDLAWLRSQIGYVDQQPALFDMSVAENVAFGPPPTAYSVARVEGALSAVGASSFVQQLPLGARTRVGEGGRQLSGGQRQRLAVARAIVRSPAVLLWDEATSALDGTSEKLVHQALTASHDGRHNRTAVIVAHRLSSVLCADRVAVLCEGRLTQLGTPQELRRQKDGWFYKNFYARGGSPDGTNHS